MARGSKQCPECGALNSIDEHRCVRCGARFRGPVFESLERLFESVLGRETPMTRLFVGACSTVFVLMTLQSGDFGLLGGDSHWDKLRWGAVSAVLVEAEPFRLLSAVYVHFGALHVLLNMMAIISFGKALEPQLGPARYIVTLILTGLLGFVASHLWYTQVSHFTGLTAGASGGVMGLAGALVGYLFARRNPAWKQIATQIVLYSVLFALMLPVNNAAHAGGLLAGLPMGYAFCKERRPYRRARLFRAVAAMLIAASVASIVLSHASDVWRAERARELMRRS